MPRLSRRLAGNDLGSASISAILRLHLHATGRVYQLGASLLTTLVPAPYNLRRCVAATQTEREAKCQRERADGRHEQRVHQRCGDPNLIDCHDYGESPNGDARHASDQVWITHT